MQSVGVETQRLEPIQLFIKVSPGQGDARDVIVKEDYVSVTRTDTDREIQVAVPSMNVIPPDELFDDYIHRIIEDPVACALRGQNAAVLVLGSANSGRRDFLHFSSTGSSTGALISAISRLYEQLGRPPEGVNFDARVRASFVQLFAESTVDLTNQTATNFTVKQDKEFGPSFVDADWKLIPDKSTLDTLCVQADKVWRNGLAEGADDRAFVCTIEIDNVVTRGGDVDRVKSALTFIELPSTDLLLKSDRELRELPDRVPTAILTLRDLAEYVARMRDGMTASYGDSMLTQLLEEAIGGNVHTSIVATVRHGQPNESFVTLELAKQLAIPRNHPIEMNVRARRLLTRFRTQLATLQDKLRLASSDSAMNSTEASSLKMEKNRLQTDVHELKRQLLDEQQRHQGEVAKKDKLALLLADYRKKLEDLHRSRKDLSDQLIDSEVRGLHRPSGGAPVHRALRQAERLQVCEDMLELQIKMKQQEEKHEQELFDLQSKLHSNQVVTAEDNRKREDQRQEVDTLRSELRKTTEENRAITRELHVLRDDLQETKAQLKREAQRNDDINAEMLSVGNRAEHFERQCKALEDELRALRGESDAAGSEVAELRHRAESAEQKARKAVQERDEAHSAKMKAELQLQSVTVDFESQKLELQRELDVLRHEHDEQQITRAHGMDARERELSAAREALAKQTQSLRSELGVAKRRLEDSARQVVELRREVDRLAADAQEQRKLREEDAEQFRERLQRLLQDEDRAVEGAGGAAEGAEAGGRIEAVHNRIQELRNELVATFETREKELSERLSGLERENVAMAQQNRAVHDRLQELRDQLEDAGIEGVQVPSRKEVAQLRVDASDTEVRLTRELERAREENRSLHMHLQSAKESALSAAEQHRRMYQEAQVKLSHAQTEAQLAIQRNEELKGVIEQMKAGGARGLDELSMKQLQDMQERLLSQLQEMRTANEAKATRLETRRSRREDAGTGEELMEARAHIKSLERMLEDAREASKRNEAEVARLKAAGAGSGGGGGAGAEEMKRILKETQQNMAELQTKVQTLEHEKKRYLKMIRGLKKQVQELSQELNELRGA